MALAKVGTIQFHHTAAATLEAKAARVVGVLRELLGDDALQETYPAVAEAGAALLNSLDDAGFGGDAGVPLGRRRNYRLFTPKSRHNQARQLRRWKLEVLVLNKHWAGLSASPHCLNIDTFPVGPSDRPLWFHLTLVRKTA